MAADARPPLYTPEEYLALERAAEAKSEYLNGEIYAMSGGSPEHSVITANVTAAFVTQLRGKKCQAFSNDMKVRSTLGGLFAYPDLSIVCGEPRFHDEARDVLVNPKVIIEVLSPSTEAFDRGKKFVHYQHLTSFTDYLLIAQSEPRIDHFVKQADNQWLFTTTAGLDSKVVIASIECALRLSEVYDRIAFPENS